MKYSQVNILIGSACDMHCPYCLQNSGRSLADRKADPEEFADRLTEYLQGESPRKIMAWGGEPMLYWEKIRRVHARLKANGIQTPFRSFVITTNGRSISDDYVAYANANPDIWTTVSYHGGGFTDDQLDQIYRVHDFSFSEIITHQRTDLWDLRDFFWQMKDRYGGTPRVCVHWLRANDSCGSECYMTKNDVNAFCRHVETEVIPMAKLGDYWAQWACSQMLFERDRRLDQPMGPMCVRPDRLSIDMHGNVYGCHHDFSASNVIGNIFKPKHVIPIHPSGYKVPNRFWDSENCRHCPDDIKGYCRGGCYLSNTHDIDCYFSHKLYPLYKKMENALNETVA